MTNCTPWLHFPQLHPTRVGCDKHCKYIQQGYIYKSGWFALYILFNDICTADIILLYQYWSSAIEILCMLGKYGKKWRMLMLTETLHSYLGRHVGVVIFCQAKFSCDWHFLWPIEKGQHKTILRHFVEKAN